MIATGWPTRRKLGVGGWSYGGILTDALIAKDPRFKAATSGAGTAFPLALYGVDQYTIQYDEEIGPPWKVGLEPWAKISYAFLHADKIKTPTLFLVGEKDFNVPSMGSEQMYQALKSLGVDTQLVVYPGQFHGLTMPSYERDRLQRYLAWFGRYLTPAGSATAQRPSGMPSGTARIACELNCLRVESQGDEDSRALSSTWRGVAPLELEDVVTDDGRPRNSGVGYLGVSPSGGLRLVCEPWRVGSQLHGSPVTAAVP